MKKVNEHFPIANELHTDVLEKKYGTISAKVLRHDNTAKSEKGKDRIREARLVDKDDILRTYALTFLTYDKSNKSISMVDKEIRNGGLIGKTFRKYGYTIKKNVVDVFMLSLPKRMKTDFRSKSKLAKSRITEFYAKKGNKDPIIYGFVLEVYSPDFKDPDEGINEIDLRQINPLTGSMWAVGIPIDEIWDRLDDSTDEGRIDMQAKYDQAKKVSQDILKSLHEKIRKYIEKKER